MRFTRLKRVATGSVAAAFITGTTLSGCSTLLRMPDATLAVSRHGVSIDFPGALVTVSHEQIVIDLFGLELEFDND